MWCQVCVKGLGWVGGRVARQRGEARAGWSGWPRQPSLMCAPFARLQLYVWQPSAGCRPRLHLSPPKEWNPPLTTAPAAARPCAPRRPVLQELPHRGARQPQLLHHLWQRQVKLPLSFLGAGCRSPCPVLRGCHAGRTSKGMHSTAAGAGWWGGHERCPQAQLCMSAPGLPPATLSR